jgi:hypothetical protein
MFPLYFTFAEVSQHFMVAAASASQHVPQRLSKLEKFKLELYSEVERLNLRRLGLGDVPDAEKAHIKELKDLLNKLDIGEAASRKHALLRRLDAVFENMNAVWHSGEPAAESVRLMTDVRETFIDAVLECVPYLPSRGMFTACAAVMDAVLSSFAFVRHAYVESFTVSPGKRFDSAHHGSHNGCLFMDDFLRSRPLSEPVFLLEVDVGRGTSDFQRRSSIAASVRYPYSFEEQMGARYKLTGLVEATANHFMAYVVVRAEPAPPSCCGSGLVSTGLFKVDPMASHEARMIARLDELENDGGCRDLSAFSYLPSRHCAVLALLSSTASLRTLQQCCQLLFCTLAAREKVPSKT